jgi:hypothetical protein
LINSEGSDQLTAPKVKPSSNLREKFAMMAIEAKPKRHSVELLAPLPCDGVEPQSASEEAAVPLPPPMLTQAKRTVKRPAPGPL